MIGRLLLALALLLGGVSGARADEAGRALLFEDLYQQAREAADAGRPGLARRLLAAAQAQGLPHAGAELDVALLYCALGERDTALAGFEQLLEQRQPPPALRALIEQARHSGCVRQLPAERERRVVVGLGYTSNANQGPKQDRFDFAPGAPFDVLLLDPLALARSSAFLETSLAWDEPLGRQWRVLSDAGLRHHADARDHDRHWLRLGLEHRLGLARGRLLLTRVFWQQQWRQSALEQRNQGLQLAWWSAPADAELPWRFGVDGQLLAQQLPLDPDGDSQRWGLRLMSHWQLSPQWLASGWLGIQHDQAQAQRPGGDRQGWRAGLAVQWLAPSGRQRWLMGWELDRWRDARAYAPLFFGPVVRDQRLSVVQLQLEQSLGPELMATLRLQRQIGRDTLPLFRHSGSQLLLEIHRRF